MKTFVFHISIFFSILGIAMEYVSCDTCDKSLLNNELSFYNESFKSAKNILPAHDTINFLFPIERKFRIINVVDSTFFLKPEDVITISTKRGLKHYRSSSLQNNYKTIPQIVAVEHLGRNELVYYLWTIKKFISIRENCFFISLENFEESYDSSQPILIHWVAACELVPS